MKNIEKYRNAFIEALELDENETLEELALGESSEWDSLGHMILISTLEEAFDVSIDADVMTEFDSYQTGIDLLTRLGVDFANE
ncbi:acyl carrier protein [Planococcus sp. CP5-4]|uniref:acyl carrier protein n=1 Tax=unclassified Planococcus (in: firmicutes) TaxID=2662419 RepID=UPI001C21D0E7|nr:MULTISPECIES: acyl carrier protein [unclassified Planococcus (in: firmicutes)]MBU9673840.1 acyl carrier protein [Planococcus sp. CP5-4_YE]MBV0908968.1 acyl carrier protein [Planococcus sp. CP5-4_UN]MBW6064017.1 acyl carrier protein [Planococcus sp. CP5-4]